MKKVAIGILCGIMMSGLVACGASGSDRKTESVMMNSASSTAPSKGSAWMDSSTGFVTDMDYSATEEIEKESIADYSGSSSETGLEEMTSSRKVIRTASLNLQTLDFDGFVQALEQKMIEAGAYLQYADVYGSVTSGSRRSGNYTIRVPEKNLDAFLAGMEGIATVTNKTLGEQDVTLSYMDMENRVRTLEIEQERLLALLEKAEDLDSIIRLEQRLSEVRYQIENYQSSLRTYDDRITYSTVQIYVYEVNRVTEKIPETVGERIKSGLSNTMYDISEGVKNFVVWIVVNAPYLAFWTIVLLSFIVVVKKERAKRLEKKMGIKKENETKLDSKE